MIDSAIQVQGVTKKFRSLVAVDHLNLTVKKGESLAILGPNGAGKTTLVEMIEGIQKPDSGSIQLLGLNWKNNEKELRKLLDLSLQETQFIDRMKVYEIILLFASFYNVSKERCNTVLMKIDLVSKKFDYVGNLSGGQKQRLALGLAILNDPAILLLDEPTTGLDPAARKEIWDILKELKNQGSTLVLTTHYMEEAETLCERIVIMHQGKIIADGNLESLLKGRASNLNELFLLMTGRQLNV